ncbi:MAG: helix-turn-helix domain-containing protein [Coriobacteriales bacterium]|jgi:hypothetical protein|nr:helix-turn-helix domain-containing protein [Coriobacteriales bacterium]
MPEGSFGERLSSARRRKGLSISQVAEALRIRPSIIEALESATFEHMPLKGYARNMISSYARYLGLNAAQITEMFLREYHVYETHEMRRAKPVIGSYPVTGALRRIEHNPRPTPPVAGGPAAFAAEQTSVSGNPPRKTVHLSQRNTSARTFWGDEGEPKQRIRDLTPRRLTRSQVETHPRALTRGNLVDNRGYSRKRSGLGRALGVIPAFFSRIFQPLLRRPVVLVIVLIVVLIALLLSIAFFAGSCSRRDVEVMPMSNVSTSTDGVSAEEVGANMEEIARQIEENARYGPFELKIEVAEGPSWLVVTVDGQQVYASVAEPGFSEVYTVTSEAHVEAAAPGYVKVYRNEKAVDLVAEEGLGVVELKVEQKPVESNANAGGTPNANSDSATATGAGGDAAATNGASLGDSAVGSSGTAPPASQ